MEVYHFGTKAALLYAINKICPNSRIEEGNEYGGDPYYFRIILDAASMSKAISLRTLIRVIDSIRPVRSVLQDGASILCSKTTVEIAEESGYIIYSVIRSGTIPGDAVSGIVRDGIINLGTMGDAAAYNARACGTLPGSLL